MPLKVSDRRLFLAPALSVSFQAVRLAPGPLHGRPRSLGALPVEIATDLPQAPAAWRTHEGVIVPLDPAMTFWLGLYNERRISHALKVRVARTNAISGYSWDGGLLRPDPQNYLVAPPQRALYGIYRAGVTEPFRFHRGLEQTEPGVELLGFPARRQVAWKHPHSPIPDVLHSQEPNIDRAAFDIDADPVGCSIWNSRRAYRALVFVVSFEEYQVLTGKPKPVLEDSKDPIPRLP